MPFEYWVIIAILFDRYNCISASCDRSIWFHHIKCMRDCRGVVIARTLFPKVRDQCGEADEQHQTVVRLSCSQSIILRRTLYLICLRQFKKLLKEKEVEFSMHMVKCR